MTAFYFMLIGVNLSIGAAQSAPMDTLFIENQSLEEARTQIVIITLNPETDQNYGEFYSSGKHLEKIADLLAATKAQPPKAVGIDISLFFPASNLLDETRGKFLNSLKPIDFPIIFGTMDSTEGKKIQAHFEQAIPNFMFGHCITETSTPQISKNRDPISHIIDFLENPEPEAEKKKPLTNSEYRLSRSSRIQSSLPYQMLSSSKNPPIKNSSELESFAIRLESEDAFEKLPLQDALAMPPEILESKLKGKYVLIGADYPHIDIKESGVNGVFYLAEALATFLYWESKNEAAGTKNILVGPDLQK